MKHQTAGRKLNRPTDHRLAMLANLAGSIILYEKVRTTEAKGKEIRGYVDELITKAKNGTLHDRRQVLARLHNNELVTNKLFEVLAPRFADRKGGYTSIVKLENRPGDNAPMVQISLMDNE